MTMIDALENVIRLGSGSLASTAILDTGRLIKMTMERLSLMQYYEYTRSFGTP
jgi:hypothetical protein